MLVNVLLAAAAVQHVAASLDLGRRQTACSDLQLVIARGTDEPNAAGGQFGIIVGDPLFNATKLLVPDVTGYAVNYPASLDCDSESIGITDVINHLNTESAACPNQKFALVGYSQGADVINRASNQISTSLYPSIVAIVQFGDPNNRGPGQVDPLGGTTSGTLPAALAAKTRENCAEGDPVCTNDGADFTQHLSYDNAGTTYINGSAKYIAEQLADDGTTGPDDSDDAPPGNQTDANISALLSLASFLGDTSVGACSSTSSGSASSTPASTSATVTASSALVPRVTGTAPIGTGTTYPWGGSGGGGNGGSGGNGGGGGDSGGNYGGGYGGGAAPSGTGPVGTAPSGTGPWLVARTQNAIQWRAPKPTQTQLVKANVVSEGTVTVQKSCVLAVAAVMASALFGLMM